MNRVYAEAAVDRTFKKARFERKERFAHFSFTEENLLGPVFL